VSDAEIPKNDDSNEAVGTSPEERAEPPRTENSPDFIRFEFNARPGASEQGNAAAKALGAMDRAARSFTLYDPGNSAVSHFLEEIEAGFQAYLKRYGAMDLRVRPYELVVEEEVIYEETDRERSLAFKLFRDGVRRLVVARDVPWEELLQLLQILSVRFSGIRSNEDDLVTLLWKAGFKSIEVEAVEGFVPEDEEDESADVSDQELRDIAKARTIDPAQAAAGLKTRADSDRVQDAGAPLFVHKQELEASEDFDLPLPAFPLSKTPVYQFVADEDYERLMSEDGASALPEDCIRLVSGLIRATQESSFLDPNDFLPLLVEIRDFMLTQGQLENLMLLLETVGDYAAIFEADHAVHRMLGSFANTNALGRLIRSVPASQHEPPDAFYELLDSLPGDHLQTLLEILLEDRSAHSRRITRQMIERYGHGQVERIKATLMEAKGAVAADLMRALAHLSSEDALMATQLLMGREEIEVLLECMHLLEKHPDAPESRPVILAFMRSPEENIRIRAIELLGERRDRRDFPPLQRQALSRALSMSQPEALAIGRSMAKVDPVAAMALFEEWLRPRGLLKRMRPVQNGQDITAIGGLEHLDFEEAEELLKILSKRAGGKIYKMCMTARSRRRRRMQGLGSP
jgi:hypothetical protein